MANKKLKGARCTDCKHYRNVEGDMDCTNSKVEYEILEKYGWEESILPSVCGHFDPYEVGECANCGEEIGAPRVMWPLFIDLGIDDRKYVCSFECKKELHKNFLEELSAVVKDPAKRKEFIETPPNEWTEEMLQKLDYYYDIGENAEMSFEDYKKRLAHEQPEELKRNVSGAFDEPKDDDRPDIPF